MIYELKVRLLKNPKINYAWRRAKARRGHKVGNYSDIPGLIRRHANGYSFVDIGGMWGVNGEYAFVAEEAGATRVRCLDVFGPTPEFLEKRSDRDSSVEFVLADITDAERISSLGKFDIVFCAGVLYHHPSPFDIVAALRKLCARKLILRSSTIPEKPGQPNFAVYWPMMDERERARWNLSSLGLRDQVGITGPFEGARGYSNWFWGMTPSCLESLLTTAGFKVKERFIEPFAHTVVCNAVAPPLLTETPSEEDAMAFAAEISSQGVAKPA